MNRCMMLACFLFKPYRDSTRPPVLNEDGSLDEAQTFTPAMLATILRLLRIP